MFVVRRPAQFPPLGEELKDVRPNQVRPGRASFQTAVAEALRVVEPLEVRTVERLPVA